jgi:hypothetical protein
VVASENGISTYTGQAAIRDRHHQVLGYLDEQRERPVVVKTIQAVRTYRCKKCGRRWESTELGNVTLG